ncbi:hypothetical protein BD413DRAFT_529072 [Trametes elegans]|nr:hypothetical protein BD413DRAFT_529072 [Trametes elegans]
MWWQFAFMIIATGAKKTHDIHDDMESLLYVVFYCALLRLPQCSFSSGTLRTTLEGFFDQCQVSETSGTYRGGDGKAMNMQCRTFTDAVTWRCPALGFWLETMFDFLCPTRETPIERRDKWTPHDVNAYWNTFLFSNSLPESDAVNNILNSDKKFESNGPAKAFNIPNQPTMAAGSKRTFPEPFSNESTPAGGSRPRKRARHGEHTHCLTVPGSLASHHHPSTIASSVSYASSPPASLTPCLTDEDTPGPRIWLPATLSQPGHAYLGGHNIMAFGNTESKDPSVATSSQGPLRVARDMGEEVAPLPGSSALAKPQQETQLSTKKSTDRAVGTKRLRVYKHSLSPFNLCKKAYSEANPSANVEGFNAYWDALGDKGREVYEQQSANQKVPRKKEKVIARRKLSRPGPKSGA